MLIYDKNGKLININKNDFSDDKSYYKQIMIQKNHIKQHHSNTYNVIDMMWIILPPELAKQLQPSRLWPSGQQLEAGGADGLDSVVDLDVL